MEAAQAYSGAIDRGLEGVVACTTGISTLPGSTLLYRGYTIEELAAHSTFEEVVYLLWFGRPPRRAELADFSAKLRAQMALFEMSARIDDPMQKTKELLPNVDFYSATVYHSMGIPTDLFTPVFAMSRVAGWCAHVLEQYANNRIYRPRGRWSGPPPTLYVPLEERG